jgi:hypothetical protein
MADKIQRQRSEKAAERTGRDPFVLASLASIPLSWYYFYVKKDRERGLLVGLWAPTLLAFGSYFRQARMNEMMERESSDIVSRVQRMVKEQ